MASFFHVQFGSGFVAVNPNSKVPRAFSNPEHVIRWTDHIATRPAVQRGRMVNRAWGDPSSQLPERHDASDFDKVKPAE